MVDDQRPSVVAPSHRESIQRMLASRRALRQAFLLREILGPPVGLRERLSDTPPD